MLKILYLKFKLQKNTYGSLSGGKYSNGTAGGE